jgi:hypothetical protein
MRLCRGTERCFEFRSAEGEADRLPALAAELVALKVDLIVTPGSLAEGDDAFASSTTSLRVLVI